MVVVFVGAGSYVFGPSVIQQALASGLSGVEFRLVDPNVAVVEPLAAAANAEAGRLGRDLHFSAHHSYDDALDGADYVIHSAAPGMRAQFARNREVIAAMLPGHHISEFGGVHGIVYSVTQAKFTASLCEAMLDSCPEATLLTSANPLPRVCTAAQRRSVETVGFCSVAIAGLRAIGARLFGIHEDYPFAQTAARVEMATGGTNHLSWVVHLRDKQTGEDLLPRLRSTAQTDGKSKVERYLAATGYMLAPGDDHVNDFLPIDGTEEALEESSHGNDADRARRVADLAEVLAGRKPFAALDEHPSWEHPVAVIEALSGGPEVDIITLNLPNTGQIPQLPMGAVVETPVHVSAAGLVPMQLDLPEAVAHHNRLAVEITERIVTYALDDDLNSLEQAVELDPTILDKKAGLAAVKTCLA